MQKRWSIFFVALALGGCVSEPSDSGAGSAAASSSAQKPKARWGPISGPALEILAGKGTGPIRLGATIATVERLMQGPCEVRSENLCRYVTRGVDFHLLGGLLQWIHVQRPGRPAGRSANGDELVFGFFNGMIPPDLRLGMTPEAIQEYLGKPVHAEKVAEPNPQQTVYVHYYPGLVAEYDRWSNGRLILGGIRIVRDPNASAAAPLDAGVDAGTKPANDGGAVRPLGPIDAGAPTLREPEPR